MSCQSNIFCDFCSSIMVSWTTSLLWHPFSSLSFFRSFIVSYFTFVWYRTRSIEFHWVFNRHLPGMMRRQPGIRCCTTCRATLEIVCRTPVLCLCRWCCNQGLLGPFHLSRVDEIRMLACSEKDKSTRGRGALTSKSTRSEMDLLFAYCRKEHGY